MQLGHQLLRKGVWGTVFAFRAVHEGYHQVRVRARVPGNDSCGKLHQNKRQHIPHWICRPHLHALWCWLVQVRVRPADTQNTYAACITVPGVAATLCKLHTRYSLLQSACRQWLQQIVIVGCNFSCLNPGANWSVFDRDCPRPDLQKN
jgi:hypothetical protein